MQSDLFRIYFPMVAGAVSPRPQETCPGDHWQCGAGAGLPRATPDIWHGRSRGPGLPPPPPSPPGPTKKTTAASRPAYSVHCPAPGHVLTWVKLTHSRHGKSAPSPMLWARTRVKCWWGWRDVGASYLVQSWREMYKIQCTWWMSIQYVQHKSWNHILRLQGTGVIYDP